jgi:hypothetical protein
MEVVRLSQMMLEVWVGKIMMVVGNRSKKESWMVVGLVRRCEWW